MRYAIVVTAREGGYRAEAPDLDHLAVCGRTVGEAEQRLRSAMSDHVRALRARGLPLPKPRTLVGYVVVEEDGAPAAAATRARCAKMDAASASRETREEQA